MDEWVRRAPELWKTGLPLLASEGVLSLTLTLTTLGMLFKRFNTAWAVMLGLSGAFATEYFSSPGTYGFLFVSDFMSRQACLVSDLLFIGGVALMWVEKRNGARYLPEHFALMAAMNLGVHLTAKANHGLAAFAGMELTALSAYVLTALGDGRRPEWSAEAGMKFLIFGAATSAVFLYGWSWYFGATGSLALTNQNPGTLAAGLLAVGLLMKIGGAPMHFWAPDVFQAGPSPVAAVLAGPSKLAGFVLAMRIFPQPSAETTATAVAAGAASLLLGNLAALRQTDFRRLLGYSNVAHTGLMLLVFAGGGGQRAVVYYLSLYGTINLLALATASFQQARTGSNDLNAWKGSGAGTTGAAAWGVSAAALSGLPPTAGFAAKVVALLALWKSLGWAWTLFALANAVVGLFVYFKAPYHIYFHSTEKSAEVRALPLDYPILVAVLAAAVVFLGVWGYGGSL